MDDTNLEATGHQPKSIVTSDASSQESIPLPINASNTNRTLYPWEIKNQEKMMKEMEDRKEKARYSYSIDGPLYDDVLMTFDPVILTEVPKSKPRERDGLRITHKMIQAIKKHQAERKLPLLQSELLQLIPKNVYKDLVRKDWLREKALWLSVAGKVEGGARNVCWISPTGFAVLQLLEGTTEQASLTKEQKNQVLDELMEETEKLGVNYHGTIETNSSDLKGATEAEDGGDHQAGLSV